MTPRIVNLTTGEITPLQVVWSDTDHTPVCEFCGTYEPFCTCDDDNYRCDDCGQVLTSEEVEASTRYDMPFWICDACTEQRSIIDWNSRSHEAQDRAVLRGWG